MSRRTRKKSVPGNDFKRQSNNDHPAGLENHSRFPAATANVHARQLDNAREEASIPFDIFYIRNL